MDIAGLLGLLTETGDLPFRVQIGGFHPGERYPFEGFGRHPYVRSFEVQSSNAVVTIGWPVDDGRFPDTLDKLRREFARYNVLHKYHRTAGDIDHDFFLVLGKLDG
jgi:hypothetical protein